MAKNIYNPMSKEFQDECKKLGLTGRQLTVKYQKEGKFLEKGEFKYKHYGLKGNIYTDKELLWYLIQFYEKYGRPPSENDFRNNSDYPSFMTYIKRFESWSNALKLVGLDVDSMIKKGIIKTEDQKARFSEMIVRDHFKEHPIDLAGENKTSSCDGICPNGKTYDVKSSGLHGMYYRFHTNNKYKEEIEIYYFLAFNADWTKLDYAWRVPGEIAESDTFYVGLNSRYKSKFTIHDMKEYDITDELMEILIKNGYFEKIENYRKAREKGMTIYEYDKQLYDGYMIVE